MAMRDDFCVFILSHGRPDRVMTYSTIKRAGYTGKVFVVIDDEDKCGDQYRSKYGDEVIVFSKSEQAETTDIGDNFNGRGVVVFARNACFRLARERGIRYFWVLDDDYMSVRLNFKHDLRPTNRALYITKHLDDVLEAMIDFYASAPITSLAMAQGGDLMGGPQGQHCITLRRKAMNSFLCATNRPFQYMGRINEDTTAYVTLGRCGAVFFTMLQAAVFQPMTQMHSGGLTEAYKELGTHVKSFYTVMYAPSCTKIGELGAHYLDGRQTNYRIHHKINWNVAVPKIIREQHRKGVKR